MERKRGVKVDLLDLGPVLKDVRKWAEREGIEGDPSIGDAPWAVGTTPDGETWAVCEEGVGYRITDESPLELDIYFQSGNTFDVFPRATVKVALDDLDGMRSGESVDLADFVRKFGSRLERNFYALDDLLRAPSTC